MATEVIILAQGNQARLRGMSGYKQLIPLPHCAGAPILVRTIQQLCRMLDADSTITIVGWPGFGEPVLETSLGRQLPKARLVTLGDPGNSSLKGIARYLELRGSEHGFDATVVLLGDVIYSWAALEAIMAMRVTGGFVGTSDLSASGGELWGVAWSSVQRQFVEIVMIVRLGSALKTHPRFDETYQPGQLRRWISAGARGDLAEHRDALAKTGEYVSIDDYTRDIDVPSHVAQIPELSMSAAVDDARNGLLWSSLSGDPIASTAQGPSS